jgi:hypothetical protein
MENETDLELLVYATTLEGEEPPPIRMVLSARQELGALASLCEDSHPGFAVEVGELGAALEQIGRRLDVAFELLTRTKADAQEGCV